MDAVRVIRNSQTAEGLRWVHDARVRLVGPALVRRAAGPSDTNCFFPREVVAPGCARGCGWHVGTDEVPDEFDQIDVFVVFLVVVVFGEVS